MITTELSFIDYRIPNWEKIVDQFPIDKKWFLIDENVNGLSEMVRVVNGFTNLNAIHIFSHGEPGKLFLGAVNIDFPELFKYRSSLSLIQRKLTKDADIFLYGCKVANGVIGRYFIDALSLYTGVAVHASTNNIGSASQGGNWNLDVSTSLAHYASFQPVSEIDLLLGNTSPTFFAGNGTQKTNNRLIDKSEVLLASGKILTSYTQTSYDQRVIYLTRVTADGSSDVGFTSNIVTSGSPPLSVSDISVQADGKILVAGNTYGGPDINSFVVRRNSDGSIDNSFGSSLYARVVFGFDTSATSYNTNDYSNAIGISYDGSIFVVGRTAARKGLNGLDWEDSKFAITKLSSSGVLVLKVNENITAGYDSADAVSILGNGSFLVAGRASNSFVVVKYSNGIVRDSSFGSSGLVTSDLSSVSGSIGMVLDGVGRIIIYGHNNNQGFLVRYNSNGSLDSSFSQDGKLFINNFQINDVTIDASGRVLVRGLGVEYDALRYIDDGSIDYSYGAPSSSTLDANAIYVEGNDAIVLDAEVRIFDAELYSAGNYANSVVSIFRNGGANSDDVFSNLNISDSLSEGAAVNLNGVQIGLVMLNSGGILTVIFNENATQELINNFLSSIAYKNTSDAPPESIEIKWQFSDGISSASLSTTGITSIQITSVNDVPLGSVVITGDAVQGSVLTASNSLVDPDGIAQSGDSAVKYQWFVGGSLIPGAVSRTYSPVQGDVGQGISVSASYIDNFGTAETVSSSATSAVANVNDAPSGAVTISGTATQGQTLTASNTLSDADGIPASGAGSISYQWKADGVAISGATSSSYTPLQAQVGKAISVSASYTDSQGTAETVSSSATSAVANVNDAPSGAVTITGTATQGQTLTASNTLSDADGIPASGAGSISYQWKADGVAISGATNSSYTLLQAQVGKAISVSASYTDSQGTAETVGSSATSAVANVNDAPSGAVTITGTATQGQTLTASNTLSDADGIPASGAGSISYQWKADGVAISGATNSSYTLTQAQVGKAITVTASYTDSQGTAETVSSSATSAVANVNDAPSGAVTITGTATQGQTLTASNTLSDADGIPASGAGSISYQWKADGVAISGATNSSYTLTQAQVGKAITVTASYTDSQGTAEAVSSNASSNVVNIDDAAVGVIGVVGTSAVVGSTLVARLTGVTDIDGTITAVNYQWKENIGTQDSPSWISIGSNGSSSLYIADAGFAGKQVRVVVVTTDSQGGTTEFISSTRTLLANSVPSGAVTIAGTATQGQTLTASNTLSDADGIPASGAGSISYQWKADGVAISGATSSSYTLTQAQVGKAITVTASYTDSQGTAETVSSSATSAVANVNDAPSGAVTITGTATQGQTLTASNTLSDADGIPASGAGSISYQWKADGVTLSGATSSSYTLTQAQVGKAISVSASYTDSQGTAETVSSSVTSAVANVNDAPSGAVTITGIATQGQTLTASNTLSDADGIPASGAGSISYQWKADGVAISGATSSSYTLTQAQVGKAITVSASYTDSQGTAETVSSSATSYVTGAGTSDGSTSGGTTTATLKITQVVTQQADFGIYKLSNGYYAMDASGLSVTDLAVSPVTFKTVANKAFTFKVNPAAVLAYTDGTFGLVSGSGSAWTEQKFTSEGVASGAVLKLTLSELLQKEKDFGEDINGGGIGDRIDQVFDNGADEHDGYGLYKTASGAYVIDVEGLSKTDAMDQPISLKVGAKAYAPKAAPNALLAYDDGTFGVVSGSGAAWTEQKFDKAGLASGAVLKLTLSDLLQKEKDFGEDINGGGIGDRVDQVFDNGADEHDGYGLYKTVSGAYVIDTEGLSKTDAMDQPISLKVGAKAYAPKAAPNALLAYDDGTFGVVSGSGAAWTEQKFDKAGLASGAVLKLTLSELLQKEKDFGEDINGGGIGDRIDQVFDNGADEHDGYGLYKTASGAYVIDVEGLSKTDAMDQPISLKVGGKAYVPKAAPKALLAYDDETFGVVSGSGAAWTEQKFDGSGLATGALIKLTLSTMLSKETELQEDINGDGVVGDQIASVLDGDGYADSVSPLGLYKTSSGGYVLDSSGKSVTDGVSQDAHPVLAAGKTWAPKGSIVAIAEKDSGYVEVLLKSGTAYTTQKINAETGLLEGAAAKLKAADQIVAREYYYEMDLNGDQQISLVGQENPPTDWTL